MERGRGRGVCHRHSRLLRSSASASAGPPLWLSFAMVCGLLLCEWYPPERSGWWGIALAETTTASVDQSAAIRINCGGRGFTDRRGRAWADDRGFEWSSAPSVAGTLPAGIAMSAGGADDPDAIYRSFRVFDLSKGGTAGYRFLVESSTYYVVRVRFTVFYYDAGAAPLSLAAASAANNDGGGGGGGGDGRVISLPSFGIAIEGIQVVDLVVSEEQAAAAAAAAGGAGGNATWIPIEKEFLIYMQNRGLKILFLPLSATSAAAPPAAPPSVLASSAEGGGRSLAQVSAIEIVPIAAPLVAAHMDFKEGFPSVLLRLEHRVNCGGEDVPDTGAGVFAWRSDRDVRFDPPTSAAVNSSTTSLLLPSSPSSSSSFSVEDEGYLPQAVRSTGRIASASDAEQALRFVLNVEPTNMRSLSGFCVHTYHDLAVGGSNNVSAADLALVREGVQPESASWVRVDKIEATTGVAEDFLTILTEYRLLHHGGGENRSSSNSGSSSSSSSSSSSLVLQTRHCFANVYVERKTIAALRVTFRPSEELGSITRRPIVNAIAVYSLFQKYNSSTLASAFQQVTRTFGLPYTYLDPCLDPQLYFVKCGFVQKEGVLAIRIFNLSNAGLQATIPPEIAAFGHVEELYLGWNELFGPIPTSIGDKMQELTILDLRNNSLNGSIPPALSYIVTLRSLFVDNNRLAGAIPRHFFEIEGLNFSYGGNARLCNPYEDVECNDTSTSPPWGGGGGGGGRGKRDRLRQVGKTLAERRSRGRRRQRQVLRRRRRARQRGNTFVRHTRHSRLGKPRHDERRFSPTRVGVSDGLIRPGLGGGDGAPAPPQQLVAVPLRPLRPPGAGGGPRAPAVTLSYQQFSEDELALITMNYRLKIGKGGFGNVYKGFLQPGGGPPAVAVKVATMASSHNAEEFHKEIAILSRLYHRHLVQLIGCCSDGGTRGIIYEFVPNGSLHDYLHGGGAADVLGEENGESAGGGGGGDGDRPCRRPSLDWSHRLRILIGTARALDYIHTQVHPSIIHRDVKSSNILLDDDYEAKLTDFGISMEMASTDKTHVTAEVVQGTSGYADPEYCTSGKVSERVDVYSFGVVLMEVIMGKEPRSKSMNTECDLVEKARKAIFSVDEVVKLVDPRLAQCTSSSTYKAETLLELVRLAVWCCHRSTKQRPSMSIVCHTLQDLFESEAGGPGGIGGIGGIGGETGTTRSGFAGKRVPMAILRGDVLAPA
ncbi:hypothetical protein CBR_g28081 [Chara braunii]|uniref:non-specific serine/threonine protein kinase n=1 Tax=Chara braunii TaxID=69332 RepID=A0A388L990_CHABU|nr:hypothetical protein CBR_g28081 [Chara braunii]|eukprot:GBG78856.1 hypothetical protein CBR_g28081 [Chara braunii]